MNKRIKIIIISILMFIPFYINADVKIEKPNDDEKSETTIYIFEETGIKMYSSPSINSSNEIGIIPNNTKVMVIANRIVENSQWLYVKYNKQEGWINTILGQTLYNIAYIFENHFLYQQH